MDDEYWIDPLLCNDCEGYAPEPQCVQVCPAGEPPIPWQAKKGRCKLGFTLESSPHLFATAVHHSFASAIVIWDACNVLAQRQSLPWQVDARGHLCYERQVNRGKSSITLRIVNDHNGANASPLSPEEAAAAIARFDIRAACLHLIFAAHATQLDRPWEQEFALDDRQIESYLGLEKRKDLSKLAKLALIKELAHQVCQIQADIHWSAQGSVPAFTVEGDRLWHLTEINHHFQTDDQGCRHLVGLTLRLRVGEWSRYFLNQHGARCGTAYYQYGNLPHSLLTNVMSLWQQHEGTTRILLWLLFKTKISTDQPIMVSTLMRVAYGDERLSQASSHRDRRKRLIRSFESDLEALHCHGLKPHFDPVTYPADIQPLWAKVADLPDDAEAALEFWMQDGSSHHRLTDVAPRGKWERLLRARILAFELPGDWGNSTTSEKRKGRSPSRSSTPKSHVSLSNQEIVLARKRLRMSQRALAEKIGKSQSWIRDVENGRFHAKPREQKLLRTVLGL